MEITKTEGLAKITSLVERFRLHQDSYHASGYNETQVRREFIDPFWKALGWDIDNEGGALDAYKDVVHEDHVRVDGHMKAPDYCFKIYNDRKFYVEAKKPGIDIKSDVNPAFQIKSYGWNRKLAVSIVTDFEEFAVYDCGKKPKKDDKTAVGRLCYYTFEDYITQFDFFWENFSKEAAVTGRFDKFARSSSRAKSGDTVDKEFLKSMDAWRVELAKNIAVNNEKLSEEDVNHAVQLIIDRILFLRICEGREVEPNGNLTHFAGKEKCYKGLLKYFSNADDKYNSGLFDFDKDTLTQTITIEDNVIKDILKELYEGDYNFEAIPVEILGNAYEQFLGKVIRLTKPGHHAKVEEKPEVRKAGGVYYTPQYIVDYIVKNTVGKLVEGKTPADVAKLRICDPACGSGSFLLGAFQYLLDWHLDWYLKNPVKEEPVAKKGKGKQKETPLTPNGRLSTAEKKRILLNNIYGVDIDGQAVEVTKLSLLLKALEGETEASINTQLELFHERVLPSLEENIRCGNSLIGSDYFSGQLAPDTEELKRVNPFDWKTAFPEVFKNGGFDAVIGNPPYGADYTENQKHYFQGKFIYKKGKPETYIYFIENGISLCSNTGILGFITPNAWLTNYYGKQIREFILKKYKLLILADCEPVRVFENAVVDTAITIIGKSKVQEEMVYIHRAISEGLIEYMFSIKQIDWLNDEYIINLNANPREKIILDKIEGQQSSLSEIIDYSQGVIPYKTKNDGEKNEYIAAKKLGNDWLPLLENASQVKRYFIEKPKAYIKYGPWLWCPRDIRYFIQPKILFHRVRKKLPVQLIGSIDTSGVVNRHSTSNLILRDGQAGDILWFVLGLFNSRLINWWFVKKYGVLMEVGGFKITSLRLPENWKISKNYSEIVNNTKKVTQLIEQKASSPSDLENESLQRLIDDTDRKIDALVYELYGLTEEEIKIVEGGK